MPRRAVHVFGASLATALALGAGVHCGLFAPPGEYASGGAAENDADTAAADGGAPDVVVLPDGNVVPSSAGTLFVAFGRREPLFPEDDPAWTADVWAGVLDGAGRVASWRAEQSAPVPGPFDAAGRTGGYWFTLGFGIGVGGGRGHTLQSIGWGPGPTTPWRAARVSPPGGLVESARAFFGGHVAVVGGSREVPVDGGTDTVITDEVHVAALDAMKGELGAFADAGASLLVPRIRAGVVASGGRLYVLGGRTTGYATTASVEMASADEASGTIGSFAAQPSLSLAGQDHAVFQPAAVVAEGHLYVAGGRVTGNNQPTDVVLASKIDAATGALTEFRAQPKLPRPLRDFALVAHRGVLYVVGGADASGRTAAVLTARIDANGDLSAWEETGNAPLPAPRSDGVAIAY